MATITLMQCPLRLFFAVLLALVLGRAAPGEEERKRLAEEIQDNSFLIEEAYNQEPGVVQHILNVVYTHDRRSGPDEHEWAFAFTQEWPLFSQRHQFSYTVPFSIVDGDGDSQSGFNDVLLNYRFQALMESDTVPAFAPRLSLILPTGDADEGFGNDVVGYQTNLPLSKIVSKRVTLHANAGATFFPDARGHDLDSYNLGASVIYAASANLNLMLETVANWDEELAEGGGSERTVSWVISPGMRYAFNHPGDAQTVIGVAVPIGLTSDTPEVGVFIYGSFEHMFARPAR